MQKLPTPEQLRASFFSCTVGCAGLSFACTGALLSGSEGTPSAFMWVGGRICWPDHFWRSSFHVGNIHFFCALVHFVVDSELHSCSSLLELVVVSHHTLCVDHHLPGHQPGTGTHSKVEPNLRLVSGKLVSLNRLCQVQLPYRVFHQDKELTFHLLCAAAWAKYATSHVHLRTQNTVNICFYRLVYSGQTSLCQTFGCVFAKPVHLGFGILIDIMDKVAFGRWTTFVWKFVGSWVIIFIFFLGRCMKHRCKRFQGRALCLLLNENHLMDLFQTLRMIYAHDLFQTSLVWSHVVLVVFLTESWIAGQGAYALNSSQLIQYSPDGEIDVKLIEWVHLHQKTQSWVILVENFTRNSAASCRSPNPKD